MSRDRRAFYLTSSAMSPWVNPPILAARPSYSGASDADAPSSPTGFELSPALDKGQRGGVFAEPTTVTTKGDRFDLSQERTNDPGLIRTALLFVDKLDCPVSKMISINDITISQLRQAGLAERTKVQFDDRMAMDRQLRELTWWAYKELDKREPGRWSIWQEPSQQIIPKNELSPDLAFRLEFNRGLIAPHHSVPYDDVIAFRDRHRDELIALRHYIEEAAIKLSNEGDPRAITIEIEKMDAALADYLKKARQSNIAKVVQSLTAEMDWSAAVRSALGGGGAGLLSAAQNLSLGATAAVVTGGLLAGLSIKSAAGLKKADPSPFRYIVRTEREFG